MSRIPGVLDVFEKEEVEQAGSPSPVEVRHYWTNIEVDADRVEELLTKIWSRLLTMKKWSHQGFVGVDEMDRAEGWHLIRCAVLKRLLLYRSDGCFLEETFIDGTGI